MTAVSSDNVAAVGYDSDAETLYVSFMSATTYAFYGVPEHLFKQMLDAPSKGAFFAGFIKGKYPYDKL